jgi:glucan phosphoethanolaminetransferase (alkaline phosphatase superfamily)
MQEQLKSVVVEVVAVVVAVVVVEVVAVVVAVVVVEVVAVVVAVVVVEVVAVVVVVVVVTSSIISFPELSTPLHVSFPSNMSLMYFDYTTGTTTWKWHSRSQQQTTETRRYELKTHTERD